MKEGFSLKEIVGHVWKACEEHYAQMKCENCQAADLETRKKISAMGETWESIHCKALSIDVNTDFYCRSYKENEK